VCHADLCVYHINFKKGIIKMTELQKITYTKTFLDKLARGVDPTNDAPISENDVACNPRISKCFLYVLELLDKIIKNPLLAEEMGKSAEWIITPEVVAKIVCTKVHVGLSTIARNIDDALNSSQKFTTSLLSNWLVEQGYLIRIATSGFSSIRRPSPKGLEIGIVLEDEIKRTGKISQSVKYTFEAQQFIKDHLAEIVEFAKNDMSVQKYRNSKSRTPCTLTTEELSKFVFSDAPIIVTELVNRINALKTGVSTDLKATDITNWLLDKGILQVVNVAGDNFRLPSEAGRAIGITMENRHGKYGNYSVALYDINAQEYIINNLHEIINVVE